MVSKSSLIIFEYFQNVLETSFLSSYYTIDSASEKILQGWKAQAPNHLQFSQQASVVNKQYPNSSF